MPTCARKRYLEIAFESCVGWPECTCAAVKETWETTLTDGVPLRLKGRVDFTCPNCFCQTHFASAVEHELVNPDVDSVLSWRRVSCEEQLDTFHSSLF